jgi:mercuric ion binding protein
MKTLRIFSIIAVLMAVTSISFAQTKTETFKVSGNCGMCKSNIEKAAKAAGATSAAWNEETKDLTVKYSSSSTNTAKIQQKIAAVGYDNVGFKSTTEAYKKLHACCQYERTETTTESSCCKDGKCSMPGHDGKDCCKKEGATMDCCKDGKCSMPGHDGKDCCKKEGAAMDCCKDGKCTKEGHSGADCCKKSH